MKTLTILLSASLFCITTWAQAPEGINYQALARDAQGSILANENLNVRFSIRSGTANGTIEYQETHFSNTNDFGLFDAVIGEGTPISGAFSSIAWGSNKFFLQVEVDPGGGMVDLGTTQLVSVPYALYAKEAGNVQPSPWTSTGADVYYNGGFVGIGTASPTTPLNLETDGTSSVNFRFENTNISAGNDMLEIITQTGAPDNAQFIEFQRGSTIEARVNTNGSAEFFNVTVDESLDASTTPIRGRVYDNSLPVAYGNITFSGSITSDYGISSVSVPSTGEYQIVLNRSLTAMPAVIVTCLNSTPNDEVATFTWSPGTPNTIEVNISNGSGTAVGSQFGFVVFGQ